MTKSSKICSLCQESIIKGVSHAQGGMLFKTLSEGVDLNDVAFTLHVEPSGHPHHFHIVYKMHELMCGELMDELDSNEVWTDRIGMS